jgi:hypothetical protein
VLYRFKPGQRQLLLAVETDESDGFVNFKTPIKIPAGEYEGSELRLKC